MKMASGAVQLQITGADIPGTLRLLTSRGVVLKNTVMKDDLTVEATTLDPDSIKRLCEKRGDTVKITGRRGAYWTWKALLNRPVLLLGMLLFLLISLYFPSRVLFVRVEGNHKIPTRMILERAGECGIGFGASRRAVRSEKMKNALLESVPELQWAGVNTRGCVAVISVRERSEQADAEMQSEFGHIVALTEGVITDCTATRGTLLCMPGQAVAEGDILISGYTDTGLAIRAEQAQGEIYGLTTRELNATTLSKCLKTMETGEEKKKITLLLGKKRINLWKDSGIWDITCDRMYEEYYITLPGGFQLPAAIAVERFRIADPVDSVIPQERLQILLEDTAKRYLAQLMLAGSIQDSALAFEQSNGAVTMAGKYRCNELIGVMQRLQIGETNGENN